MISEILIFLIETIAKINPVIPYYHVVSDEILPHVRHLYPYKNVSRFIDDIEYLGRKFNPVSLSDLFDFVKNGKTLKKRSLLITIDDGYSECAHTIAPLLFKKGIQAAFFVCPDFIDNKSMSYKNKASLIVEKLLQEYGKGINTLPFFRNCSMKECTIRILNIGYRERHILDEIARDIGLDWNDYIKTKQPYMTSQQIAEMKNMGFYFGGHSLDHANFDELNIDEQIYQAKKSIDFIKKGFNIDYSIFAFPFSDKNIPIEFFIKMKEYVDISFGTAGTQIDNMKWNLERINFERSLKPANKIYFRKLLRRKLNLIQGKGTIQRL